LGVVQEKYKYYGFGGGFSFVIQKYVKRTFKFGGNMKKTKKTITRCYPVCPYCHEKFYLKKETIEEIDIE